MSSSQRGYIFPLIFLLNIIVLMSVLSITEQSLRYVHLCKSVKDAVSDQHDARKLLAVAITEKMVQECQIVSISPMELNLKTMQWWKIHGCRMLNTQTQREQWIVVEQMPVFRSKDPMIHSEADNRSDTDNRCFSYFRMSVLQISSDMSGDRVKHFYQRVQKIAWDCTQEGSLIEIA